MVVHIFASGPLYCAVQIQLMVPDDFPSMDLPNTYHTPRPKDPFGSVADMNLGSDEPEVERQPTMQLRLQLQVQNTGDFTDMLIE